MVTHKYVRVALFIITRWELRHKIPESATWPGVLEPCGGSKRLGRYGHHKTGLPHSKLGPKSWSYRASAFLTFNNSCNLGVVNRRSGRFCLLFPGIAPPVGLQGLEISPFRATESCIVLGVLVIRKTPLVQVLVNGVKCYSTEEGISLDTEDPSYPRTILVLGQPEC